MSCLHVFATESHQVIQFQIAQEAERRKTSEIRSLKDSYEIRLTQITKSAKTEINRLVSEFLCVCHLQ